MSGNMYEFINKTPNPLAGECSHKCSYCYVEKMKTRYTAIREKYSGEPRLWPAEFKKKYKPSDTIFVCDCNDLFAENVPDEIIKEVLSYYDGFMCKLFLQTKNPVRVQDFRDKIGFDSIICTTIETNRCYHEKMGFAPLPEYRAIGMSRINLDKFVTIEPIMDFDLYQLVELIKIANPSQVNLGADSGNNHLPEPSKGKILALITELEKFTKIHSKTNLKRLLK